MNLRATTLVALALVLFSTAALAADTGPWPRVGGHFGMAVPLFSLSDPVTVIGRDFVSVGLTPGVTVKLDAHWSIDFELIAFNELKNSPAATTLVVDPGVLYDFGPVVVGGRLATQVGAPTNFGLVPIIVVPFKISPSLSYFVEGDVPMFLRDRGNSLGASIGLQFQTGIAF